MVSNYIQEKKYPGEGIVTEANGYLSRETGVIARGQVLEALSVLGKVLIGGSSASASAVVGTGNGTVGSLTATGKAKIGVYTLVCTTTNTNGGIFAVTDPDGINIGTATVGLAFLANGLGFTIADGSTDYVLGDSFSVTVSPATVTAGAGNVGNGVFGTVAVSSGAKPGAYKVVFIEPVTNLGNYTVEDPSGVTIGTGKVGTAFSAAGIAFTIADGSTDFAAGDSFTIAIAAGSGEYRALKPSASDGTEFAEALLFGAKDATSGSVKAVVIVRDVEVSDSCLVWPANITSDQKAAAIAQLAKRNIILRKGVGSVLSGVTADY